MPTLSRMEQATQAQVGEVTGREPCERQYVPLVTQKVQKTVEMLQVQFLDEIDDVPL